MQPRFHQRLSGLDLAGNPLAQLSTGRECDESRFRLFFVLLFQRRLQRTQFV
jgi:hypothetical protein